MRLQAGVVLALVACTGKGSVSLTDDSAVDTGPPVVADETLCGAYSGLSQAGQVWTYAFSAGESTGQVIREVVELGEGTGTLRTSLEWTSEAAKYASTTTTNVICDDGGMSVASEVSEWSGSDTTATTEGWQIDTYDPPYLVLARGLTLGQEWTGTTNLTRESSQAATTTDRYTYSFLVGAEEVLTVQAGTYTALRIDARGTLGSQQYVAEDVGTVKTTELELVSLAR